MRYKYIFILCFVAKANSEEGASEAPPSEDKNSCLLATGSRDRTIRIWSLARGRPVNTLRLPTNTGYSRSQQDLYEDQGKTRVWVTLHWPTDRLRQLVSSSFK